MGSMLTGAPWLLAHKSMLAVNQPRQLSLCGRDYVLWKDPTDQVYALPNSCPHMGAKLSEGWCESLHIITSSKASGIVCPFHALKYDGAGCTRLPGAQTQTPPQLEPLELVVQGDFIWSYGEHEPQVPIPAVVQEIASHYQFVGHTADFSVETDLLSMLLIMHDYNHQNGTHRELFRITHVDFHQFIDNGHHSQAFYEMPMASHRWWEKLRNPGLFLLGDVISAHLENYFPALVILHSESPVFGKVAQCHFFVPEAEHRTRTYNLLFMQAHPLIIKIFGKSILKLGRIAVEQDVDILSKRYVQTSQSFKLNHEIGMDWVKRNFKSFPNVIEPNLSGS